MRYLGIDYGKKKIGFAVSDGSQARPLKGINVTGLKDAVVKIKRLIEQQEVELVVIGIPESGESRAMTKRFIKSVEDDLKIVKFEETLSSHNARILMKQIGVRNGEDSLAAAEILQNYLDIKNAKK